FNDAGVAMSGYNLTRDQLFKTPYEGVLTRIRGEFSKMDETAASDPDLMNTVRKMEVDAKPGIEKLEDAKQKIDAGGSVDVGATTDELKSIGKKLTSELNRLTAEDKKLESAGGDKAQQTRNMIQLILGAGVVLNICLTVLLAGFFSRGITGRLKVLTD